MSPDRRRARSLLIGTFLVFFLPIVGAWLLNVLAPEWRPFGTVNHGTLVQPVRPVTAASLQYLDGATMDPGYLSGRWTLVHMRDGVCGQSCIEALARSLELQQALGEDMHRLQLLLVLTGPVDARSADLPRGVALAVADSDWLASFSFVDTAPGQDPGIYLVDPQGYLMMRYPQNVDQRSLLADLERLLKISKIG
jgi:cytochrome oxidase Cu insertion factor (SCO1/SenC/PrrC family)